jgi:hypothetical protein
MPTTGGAVSGTAGVVSVKSVFGLMVAENAPLFIATSAPRCRFTLALVWYNSNDALAGNPTRLPLIVSRLLLAFSPTIVTSPVAAL